MDCFSRIPLELLPNILRFAAVDAVRDDPARVAALARFSRAGNQIVRPILYELVQINSRNLPAISVSNSSAFSYTRHLVVLERLCLSSSNLPPALDLALIEAYTGDVSTFKYLASRSSTFRPHSVSFPGGGGTVWYSLDSFMETWLQSPARIHARELTVYFVRWYMQGCVHLTHVTLEPEVLTLPTLELEDVEGLVALCCSLLALPQMQHLAVRTGRLCPDEAASVSAELATLATATKDPRLFLDGACLEWTTPRREAFAPQSMWEGGRQLYTGAGELAPSATDVMAA